MNTLKDHVNVLTDHMNVLKDQSLWVQQSFDKVPAVRVIFAHGAGAGMTHEFMQDISFRLIELANQHQISLEVVRFNFPYMRLREKTNSKRPPDRAPKLLADFAEHLRVHHFNHLHHNKTQLFIAGKSMGGRMASLLVSDDAPEYVAPLQETHLQEIKGVMCLGFPFHPPKKLEKFKGEHLARLKTSLLLLQGERDNMGTKEDVSAYTLAPCIQTIWLSDGDHSFKPRVRSGFTEKENRALAAQSMFDFIHGSGR